MAMPTQCFGTMNTWDMEAIGGALDAGYRHFDLAMLYGNHALLGAFFEERFKADASLGRSDVFLTTKIWTRHMRDPRAACEECLRDLRTDYLDCLLLHMPFGLMPNYMTAPDLALDLRAAWATLEALKAEGKVRSIGVSNFEVKHLEALLACCDVRPAVRLGDFGGREAAGGRGCGGVNGRAAGSSTLTSSCGSCGSTGTSSTGSTAQNRRSSS